MKKRKTSGDFNFNLQTFSKKKIFILIALIIPLIFGGCFSKKDDFTENGGSVEAPSELSAEITESILGDFEFTEDSDGSKPNQDATITATFNHDGTIFLSAVQPDETLETWGFYSIESDKMTLSFPEIDKKADSQIFEVDSERLTLPIQIIGDGEGTSKWKRIDFAENPTKQGQQYLQYLLSHGENKEKAVRKTASFLEKQDGVKEVHISEDKKNISIQYDSGPLFVIFSDPKPPIGKPEEQGETDSEQQGALQEFFLPTANAQFMPGMTPLTPPSGITRESIAAQKHDAWLANEPNPLDLGDAPPNRKALILDPLSLDFVTKDWERNASGQIVEKTVRIGNPDAIAKHLASAGYDNNGPLTEDNFNFEIKSYVDFFTDEKPYGVIYWATHGARANTGKGDQFFIFLGIKIGSPGDSVNDLIKKFQAYINSQFQQIPAEYQGLKKHLALDGSGQLIATSDFIKEMRPKTGMLRFERSLVYIDACQSLSDMSLRDAFNAKAFVGWAGSPSSYLTSSLADDFFLNLSKKTRSTREAYDFAIDKTDFKARDSKGMPKDMKLYGVLSDINYYKLYMAGKNDPEERLTNATRGMLMTTRKYVVRQGDQDLQRTANNLNDICFAEYWSQNKDANLKQPFCNEAAVGMPKQNDVDDAIGLLVGYPDGRSRFTLIE